MNQEEINKIIKKFDSLEDCFCPKCKKEEKENV